MSFQLPTKHKLSFTPPSWSGVAFLVEAMLLLVFLTASLAVFTQLFGQAIERGTQSETLSQAVAAVSGTSERFCADPEGTEGATFSNGLIVVCEVDDEERGGGTLYHATISAYQADPDALDSIGAENGDALMELALASGGPAPVYSVTTSKYESEVG